MVGECLIGAHEKSFDETREIWEERASHGKVPYVVAMWREGRDDTLRFAPPQTNNYLETKGAWMWIWDNYLTVRRGLSPWLNRIGLGWDGWMDGWIMDGRGAFGS